MRMHANWFSLRVYDCFEMLFMRLNEDCRLLSYENNMYEVCDPEMIGLDKFWYIYFNCSDNKVVKKCRDFLLKLSSYPNTHKAELAHTTMVTILKYL